MYISQPKPTRYQITFESQPMIDRALARAAERGDDPATYEPDPDELYDELDVPTIAAAKREAQGRARARKEQAPRVVSARCADCGGPLSKVVSVDGDYWVCGLPHEFGVAQRCAGIRAAGGTRAPFTAGDDDLPL